MSTRPPLIGITTYPRDRDGWFRLPAEYVDSIRRAGGLPVLLAPGEPLADQALLVVDGLLLAGGGDIDPQLYGGASHPALYGMNNDRDRTELALARRALDTGLPTLGICRGQQLLNVALGGTLIEHLPDVVGDQVQHRRPDRSPTPHPVNVLPGSRLALILGATEPAPESWHHQAIRDLAPGLEVAARARDGTIEAVELAAHPWCLAVQWHPELTAATDEAQQRLFDAFVHAAQDSSRTGPAATAPPGPKGRRRKGRTAAG